MAILSLLFVGCAAASRTASAVSAQWTIAPSAAAASTPPRLAGAVSADDDVDYSSRIEIEGMKRFGAGSFESHADLQMSLEAHGVDTSAWEQRLTKTCAPRPDPSPGADMHPPLHCGLIPFLAIPCFCAQLRSALHRARAG